MGKYVVAKLKPSLKSVDLKLKDVSQCKEMLDFRIATRLDLFLNYCGVLQDAGKIRSTIQNWYAIDVLIEGLPAYTFVVGFNAKSGRAMHSGVITTWDLHRRLLRAQNSIYALGEEGGEKIPTELIWIVCWLFHPYDIALGGILQIPKVFADEKVT